MREVPQIYFTRPDSPRQWSRKTSSKSSVRYSAFKGKQ